MKFAFLGATKPRSVPTILKEETTTTKKAKKGCREMKYTEEEIDEVQ